MISTKTRIKRFLERRGLFVRRTGSLPYGCDWLFDLSRLQKPQTFRVVLDVGANVGQTARAILDRFPNAGVIAFEPVASTYAAMELELGTDSRCTLVKMAVGAIEGSALMSAVPLAETNSLVLANDEDPKVQVPIVTIDGYCRSSGINEIDLLKIDVEGYELSVLAGAEGVLAAGRTKFVVVECDFLPHPREPHARFHDIHDFLTKRGFGVVAFYTGAVDDRGWVFGDVLYRWLAPTADSRPTTTTTTIHHSS
jgi:FkbM family methyltransferase